MNLKTLVSITLASVVFLAGFVFAQNDPRYVRFPGLPPSVKGAFYMADASTPAPHVGILVMHRTSNFMNALACTELSKTGFAVLCMNPRSDNNEALVRFESIPFDVKAGMEFLKRQPGITKIVLWGWSGGGATMTLYQSVAVNGPSACQGPMKLSSAATSSPGCRVPTALSWSMRIRGNPVNKIRSLNPAITNESRPDQLDPALDPFHVRNGYNPTGPSSYSEEFKKRYFKAQADRMNRLIDLALDKQRRMKQGEYAYRDDDAFIVPRGANARLGAMDLRIRHATIKPQKLLKNDGTIAIRIVESVEKASPENASQNATFESGTLFLTVRSFLSANAVRATDSMEGIDYCSSNNAPPCHLREIRVPLLIAGAAPFIRDNEIHYEVAASEDKDFVVVEGAEHGQRPSVPCESSPGQYSNTVKNFYDYARDWINKRF